MIHIGGNNLGDVAAANLTITLAGAPCPFEPYFTSGSRIACRTAAHAAGAVTVAVTMDGRPVPCASTAACRFTYTNDRTTLLRGVRPVVAVEPGQKLRLQVSARPRCPCDGPSFRE